MKKIVLVFCIITTTLFSCSQDRVLGPGYRWELFKSTTNWELAKAVAKEDTASINQLLHTGKFNINLQEPKFGRTLLMLAVGNDKQNSVTTLLAQGADVHIRDNSDEQAIHEAVQYIKLRKHSYDILKQLIRYGADVNATAKAIVPLFYGVADSACARLLLDSGADVYYRTKDSNYLVWSALNSDIDDNLLVARYLIIEKNKPVPYPILYAYPDALPRGMFELLELLPCNIPQKCRVEEEIKSYLKKVGYPAKGVYK